MYTAIAQAQAMAMCIYSNNLKIEIYSLYSLYTKDFLVYMQTRGEDRLPPLPAYD